MLRRGASCSPVSSTPLGRCLTSSSLTIRRGQGHIACRIPMLRAGPKKSWGGRWRGEPLEFSHTLEEQIGARSKRAS